MTSTPTVLVDRMSIDGTDQQMALVTLNRPDEMNPLDWDTVKDLGETFAELEQDRDVRVVAITGAGRAFSAGGDMKKYATLQRDSVDFPQFLEDIHRIFSGISQSAKPYVALVNGVAVAGGIELVLSCDVVVASTKARIGDAHLVFGQMGGGGALTLLPRAIGPVRARELVLSGRMMDAREAMDVGLVSRIAEPDELVAAGLSFAAEVAAKSPLAVANAKRTMNAAWSEGTGITEGLRLERTATSLYCLTSDDAPEGLEAFAQKRPAHYTGR
ncbi:enoyl-CoA hydratase/isomerase family protein [Aeromicrobium piscarium]|uniref:Enoyl-CoA hydratase/isomerase family protein n=1 Tax=Aeromicrobium piscarium TaxID=2590901 RepID=A0A554S7Q8_9ACTN|nr:enoyl-CoA hydratase/isomerase family protein [Aeromicrobium piscarium]TSD62382.1 enoyl-CoA hydratase/isomerase family protein [Aeromicrobium piscarium]